MAAGLPLFPPEAPQQPSCRKGAGLCLLRLFCTRPCRRQHLLLNRVVQKGLGERGQAKAIVAHKGVQEVEPDTQEI